MTEDIPESTLNMKMGNIATGDMVSRDTTIEATNILRHEGRYQEIFGAMNFAMMMKYFAEDVRFDGLRENPTALANKAIEIADEIRLLIAQQNMKWFDFGRLESIQTEYVELVKDKVKAQVLKLTSADKTLGERVLYNHTDRLSTNHPANVAFARNRRKRGVLVNTRVAVYGNERVFLDYIAHPDGLDLDALPPVLHVNEISSDTEAIETIAEMFHQAEEKEKQTKNEIAGLRASLDEAQAFSIMAYEDQLAGLKREVNEEWKANVDRLGDEGDLEGKTFTVYFNGRHPFESLATRYRENLGGVPNWKVLCKRHEVGNLYIIVKETDPDKEYLIALGKDNVNHVFAFSFFSKVGKKWIEEEQKHIGATDKKKLTAYDLFQVYDKVSAKFGLNKKATG